MFSPLFQFAKRLEVPGKSDSYINDDIRPLPPSRRTWTKTTFIWFWLATSINIGGLSASSSILSLGLTVGQTALSDLTGSCIIMIAMIANGVQGAKWHIPFAVGNRAGWGVRGSWFVIANRLILSICWYGVQSWWGGQVVKNLIGAIWPSFYRMKNHFPLDANMETNDFIGFIIFWAISLPLLAVNPERYRIPAVISSIAVTLGVLALMIWIIVKQGDGGPLLYTTEKVTGIKPLKGAALAWAFIRAVGTTVGAWGGGILYASDFSRYAVQPGDQIYGQAFVGPFCLIIGSFIGLIITSCAAGLYPDQPLLWRPYKLIEVIQTNEGTPGARAALFFLALTFLFSQWAVNISGCAITGGIDLSAMFPRYINTLRGPFVVAIIGFAITPWNLVNTANTFISVLGSYSTFLGPLAGIMITDYLVVRRQRVRLSHLYMAHPYSIYWFWHGVNLKAVIVWALSVGPSFPGFVSVISKGKIKVPLGLVRTSYIGWMLGFAIASTLWTIVNLIWPPPGLGEVDEVDVFGTFTEQINSASGVSLKEELDEGVSEKQAVEREVGHTLRI